jgi:hypothetical protein
MTVLSAVKSEIREEEKLAVQNIKRWITKICRKKCIDTNNIFISPYLYQNKEGETIQKTVICIMDNLPEGPVIQIPKPVSEIGVEDLLGNYKLINYCKNSDQKE